MGIIQKSDLWKYFTFKISDIFYKNEMMIDWQLSLLEATLQKFLENFLNIVQYKNEKKSQFKHLFGWTRFSRKWFLE